MKPFWVNPTSFNPSTWEAEAGGSLWVRGQPGLQELAPAQAPKLQRNPVSKNQKKKKKKKEKKTEYCIVAICYVLWIHFSVAQTAEFFLPCKLLTVALMWLLIRRCICWSCLHFSHVHWCKIFNKSWAVVAYAFNPSTREAGAGRSLWIRDQPGL